MLPPSSAPTAAQANCHCQLARGVPSGRQAHIDVGAPGQQQLRRAVVSVCSGKVQRRAALGVGWGRLQQAAAAPLCCSIQQQLKDVPLAAAHRLQQAEPQQGRGLGQKVLHPPHIASPDGRRQQLHRWQWVGFERGSGVVQRRARLARWPAASTTSEHPGSNQIAQGLRQNGFGGSRQREGEGLWSLPERCTHASGLGVAVGLHYHHGAAKADLHHESHGVETEGPPPTKNPLWLLWYSRGGSTHGRRRAALEPCLVWCLMSSRT